MKRSPEDKAPYLQPLSNHAIQWFWPTRVCECRLKALKLSSLVISKCKTAANCSTGQVGHFSVAQLVPSFVAYSTEVILPRLEAYISELWPNEAGFEINMSILGSVLPSNCFRGSRQGGGNFRGVYYLACCSQAQPGRESGRLLLQDPRGGCSNVFVPGHPFGRSLLIRPRPGLLVVFPSFLNYAVTPLSPPDWQVVIDLEFRAVSLGEVSRHARLDENTISWRSSKQPKRP